MKQTNDRRGTRPSGSIVNIQNYDAPCGKIVLASLGNALCLCDWAAMPCVERSKLRLKRMLNATFREAPALVLQKAVSQLDEYFAGMRREFDLPLHPVGTDFQKRVWDALMEIPYGETRSYREIAQRVGCPKGVRAVAQAIGANGMSIVIPCHRVVGVNGTLTGFAGGLEAKRTLLELEGWGMAGSDEEDSPQCLSK